MKETAVLNYKSHDVLWSKNSFATIVFPEFQILLALKNIQLCILLRASLTLTGNAC